PVEFDTEEPTMAHDHEHSHDENYFLDQLSTVAVCGLLAGIGFLAWKVGLFERYNILTEQFVFAVMLGSVVLAAIVVVRGVALWKEAGRRKAHGHDHAHDHDHGHDHAHDHDHGHDHGHDHHHHDHGHDHHHQDHDHDHGHG